MRKLLLNLIIATFILFIGGRVFAQATDTPTITETPTITPTITNTPTLTHTPTITATKTPTNTFTNTPTRTPIVVRSAPPTRTPSNTNTITPTRTNTVPTATRTATNTHKPTYTGTPTFTPTNTKTITPTITQTPTITITPTITQTRTPTVTYTPAAGLNNYAYNPTPCPTNGTCISAKVPASDGGNGTKTVFFDLTAGNGTFKLYGRGVKDQPGTDVLIDTYSADDVTTFTSDYYETWIETTNCASCTYNAWKRP